jgi:hypothetical protein
MSAAPRRRMRLAALAFAPVPVLVGFLQDDSYGGVMSPWSA